MTLKDMFDEISDADMIAALEESEKPHRNFLNERFHNDDEVVNRYSAEDRVSLVEHLFAERNLNT